MDVPFAIPNNPPVHEQHGDCRTTPSEKHPALDSAIERARSEIDLIREYRTRLIADVVTGKLDVRQAAASLPDEAGELEDWDDLEAEGESDEHLCEKVEGEDL